MSRTALKYARLEFLCILLAVIVLLPLHASAKVYINEVAWMGTTQDPNGSYCEWIELFNDGTPVSLSSWTLSFGSTAIDLSSSLASGAYYVIERYTENACPDPVPSQHDLSISFGNGLSNNGTTLVLTRADGEIEDEVAGGEAWENIGGDNLTKDTAQRTGGGWITAPATPGVENESVGSPDASDSETEEQGNTRDDSGDTESTSEVISLTLPDNELALSISAPAIAYVNQEVPFRALPSGIGEQLMDSLRYSWNFGDTYTGGGKKTSHTFSHPGKYVVIANAKYVRHEAYARHEITVLPVTFSVMRTEKGDIQVHNNADYETDLSNFVLRGDTSLVLPENTFMLPHSSLTIKAGRIENGADKMIVLYDARGELVAMHMPGSVAQTEADKEISQEALLIDEEDVEGLQNADDIYDSEVPIEIEKRREAEDLAVRESVTEQVIPIGNSQAAAVGQAGKTSRTLPYVGLVGIIVIGILALYSRPREDG